LTRLNIKLRSDGYWLVYEVRDQEVVIVVIAVGKRERHAVYKAAAKRSEYSPLGASPHHSIFKKIAPLDLLSASTKNYDISNHCTQTISTLSFAQRIGPGAKEGSWPSHGNGDAELYRR
jgi:hypothetical protein